MSKKIPITVAYGDGIGPEIMEATLHILSAAGAPLEIFPVEIGEKVYLRGERSGIDPETWETIRNTRAFLKAPITTPQGGGFKSLNVTVRAHLGLYANIRPCASYAPFVSTKHPKMDVVIVRENEEDLYVGIEYRQTANTFHALKLITRPGCERIIRYAFEYARAYGRKKVTCFTKDNILKLSDGEFHKIFESIAQEYPEISNEHWIIDIGAAKLADTPEAFDVIVLPNLYGDILSDVAAQIAGSVGLAGSANIGTNGAMFEAIHGSAPRRAGQNVANPSGLLLASVMMLVHLQQFSIAEKIHNGWLKTLEEGIHTYDIYREGVSKQCVGTKEFARAVVERLEKLPKTLKPVSYHAHLPPVKTDSIKSSSRQTPTKETVGIDLFIHFEGDVDALHHQLSQLTGSSLKLVMISNRGVTLWPGHAPKVPCVESWRCRFASTRKGGDVSHHEIVRLLDALAQQKIDFTHLETLCNFDGIPGYTLGQEEQ